jgi:hypothetical protein
MRREQAGLRELAFDKESPGSACLDPRGDGGGGGGGASSYLEK